MPDACFVALQMPAFRRCKNVPVGTSPLDTELLSESTYNLAIFETCCFRGVFAVENASHRGDALEANNRMPFRKYFIKRRSAHMNKKIKSKRRVEPAYKKW